MTNPFTPNTHAVRVPDGGPVRVFIPECSATSASHTINRDGALPIINIKMTWESSSTDVTSHLRYAQLLVQFASSNAMRVAVNGAVFLPNVAFLKFAITVKETKTDLEFTSVGIIVDGDESMLNGLFGSAGITPVVCLPFLLQQFRSREEGDSQEVGSPKTVGFSETLSGIGAIAAVAAFTQSVIKTFYTPMLGVAYTASDGKRMRTNVLSFQFFSSRGQSDITFDADGTPALCPLPTPLLSITLM
jgi:hypothetical protein